MESLTVRVVDDEDDPIAGEEVTIFLTHTIMPQTWLNEHTDDEGRAYFAFDDCVSVDIHVRGECQLESVTDDGGEVTVSV